MGECEQHTHCAIPGDGVCPTCLQKKLTHVWRGESDSDTVPADSEVSTSMTTYQTTTADPILPKEALAIIGSIASIAKRTQHSKQLPGDITELSASMDHSRYGYNAKAFRKPHPSFDVEDGGATEGVIFSNPKPFAAPRKQSTQDIEGVMKDWTALHAKRRSSQEKKKSVTIADESPMVEYSRAGLPLVDRIAKETALRVIKEVGDDVASVEDFQEELSSANRQSEDNIWEDNVVPNSVKQQEKSTFNLSPVHWHSKIRSKWVKGLGSPLTNSSKVFPSKSVENVQKSQALASPARIDSRLKNSQVKKSVDQRKTLRFNVEPTVIPPAKDEYDSVYTSETVIEGMPDEILKPEDMNQRLRTSYNTVLSWLQDLPSPQTPLFQQIGEPEEDPSLPPSLVVEPRNNDLYGEDLTLVGHLHEIAEEHENIEESSEEEEVSTTNHLSEVSSFGKFLIRAAQRQQREGLSRVASATPGRW